MRTTRPPARSLIPALLVAAAGLAADGGSEEPLIDATTVIRDLIVELRYATPNNFLKRKVYPDDARCLLRASAVRRLEQAAQALSAKGLRLRVYDCYRPRAVQWEMWKLFPRPGYVADPRKGSNHNRGAAVDLTLSLPDGGEVPMPTEFDTFSVAAHHGYDGGFELTRQNREVLREAMEGAGFVKNRMEWWHYDLPDARRHAVLDEPFGAAGRDGRAP